MARPTLPLCAQCHLHPVKRRQHRFCSNSCTRAFQTPARPLCPQCHATPVPRARAKYCGRRCAGHARRGQFTERSPEVRERIARESRRRAVVEILADLKPFVRPDGLISTADAVKVAYQRQRVGYKRGYAAKYAWGSRRGLTNSRECFTRHIDRQKVS